MTAILTSWTLWRFKMIPQNKEEEEEDYWEDEFDDNFEEEESPPQNDKRVLFYILIVILFTVIVGISLVNYHNENAFKTTTEKRDALMANPLEEK